MNTSASFPFGSSSIFPDNGLLSTAYDLRVSQNDMARVGRELMHSEEAYYTESALDGTLIYTWNHHFVALVRQSILENKIANFSKRQRVMFDKYLKIVNNTYTGTLTDPEMILHIYLTSL